MLNPSVSEDRALLETLAVIGERTGGGRTVRSTELQIDGVSRDAVLGLVEELRGRRLIDAFDLMGGSALTISASGRLALSNARDALSRRVARVRLLQDDFLRWLHDETEERGARVSVDDFLRERPRIIGVAVEQADVDAAAKRLRDAGFVKGAGADQRPVPLWPTLTAKGRFTVEEGTSVHEPPRGGGSSTINYATTVHGNANVANGSTNVTQTMSVDAQWLQDLENVLEVISERAPDKAADVLVDEIRQEVAGAKRSSILSGLLGALRDVATNGVGGAMGGVLSSQITALLTSM